MDSADDLFQRILRFRKELGLSQQALASFLGVSQRTVSRWERKVDRPSNEVMARLNALIADRDQSQLPALFDVVKQAVIPLALIDGSGRVLVSSKAYDESREEIPEVPSLEVPSLGLPLLMVIEDDEAVLKATKAVLNRWQFLSVGVTDGEAALAMVSKGGVHPDGALIDFVLPGAMDGVDTARALQQLIPDIRIIIITGESAPDRISKIVASGLPVVTKPIDPRQLQVALTAMR